MGDDLGVHNAGFRLAFRPISQKIKMRNSTFSCDVGADLGNNFATPQVYKHENAEECSWHALRV
jgi:hypothetical protein